MSHLLKKLAFTEVYILVSNNQVTLLYCVQSCRGHEENYMESGLYWKVIWEMVWKVQFLQFFRRVLLFGHSSKQHGSRMQQIGQQLLSCCGFATRNTHHLMSENFYVFVLLWNARNKASGYFFFNARIVFSCCNFYEGKVLQESLFPHVFPNDFSVKFGFKTILKIVESIDPMIVEVIEN